MDLMNDQVVERDARPTPVGPSKTQRINNFGWAVDSLGLEPGGGVGEVSGGDPEAVASASTQARDMGAECAVSEAFEVLDTGGVAVNDEGDRLLLRGPDAKADAL